MNILSALKSEASKLQKQLNGINSAIEITGGKKQRHSSKETASLRKCTGQDGESAKSEAGGEGREEKCLVVRPATRDPPNTPCLKPI